MTNCYQGIAAETPIEAPCGGTFVSTSCIQTPFDNATLDLQAGATQTEINGALTTALVYKEQQIQELQSEIEALPIPDGSETNIAAGTNTSVTGTGTVGDPYIIGTSFIDVSATVSGIVNNTSLQELGGVDKLINGVRVGRGAGAGVENTAFGYATLSVSTGSYNTAIGEGTLEKNTTGYENTAIGDWALNDNTTGVQNTSVGAGSMQASTTASRNTAVGDGTLYYTTTANNNVAIGLAAMQNNTTGGDNVVVGYQAGGSLSTGTGNIILGHQSNVSAGLTTGNNNVFLGNTLSGITTGSGNVIIGKPAGLSGASANTIVIADGAGNVALNKDSSGLITAPNTTNSQILADSTGKAVVIKSFLPTVSGNYANDTAAAAGGVSIGQMYHTAGTVKIRLV